MPTDTEMLDWIAIFLVEVQEEEASDKRVVVLLTTNDKGKIDEFKATGVDVKEAFRKAIAKGMESLSEQSPVSQKEAM